MAMTWRNQLQRLLQDVKLAPQEGEWRIAESYRLNCAEHTWRHLLKEGAVTTEAAYSIGTVAVTIGLTTVTLTPVVPGEGWTTSWTNRKIRLEGASEVYSITINTPTTGTLNRAFNGTTTLTAGTYEIYRDVYTLPTDCDYGRAVLILDPVNSGSIAIKDYLEFQRFKMSSPGITGTPMWAAMVGLSTVAASGSEGAPLPQIEFGPEAPSTAVIYPIFYYRKPVAVTLLDGYPDWPENFEDMIWKRARMDVAASGRHPHPMYPVWKQEYWFRYAEMRGVMDGGAEVARRIRHSFPGVGIESIFLPTVRVS